MFVSKKESILIEAFSFKYLKIDWDLSMQVKRENPFIFWGMCFLAFVNMCMLIFVLGVNIFTVYGPNQLSKAHVFLSVAALVLGTAGGFLILRGMGCCDRTFRTAVLGYGFMASSICLWMLSYV
jgi:hypothetical protein